MSGFTTPQPIPRDRAATVSQISDPLTSSAAKADALLLWTVVVCMGGILLVLAVEALWA